MSFRLSNVVAAFMAMMNKVFRKYNDMFVILFIDDILMYFRSEDDHAGYLSIVLQILKDCELYAKFNKYEFWLRFMDFLGHSVSDKGIEVDPNTTKVVKNFRRPLPPLDICRFLGLTEYCRSFVEGFSYIVSPLTSLTQKKVKFLW